jgi:DNA-binding CsgD family transcriptional regulator
LPRFPGIRVCGQSATLADGLAAAETLRPTTVLLDVAFPGGLDAVFPPSFPKHTWSHWRSPKPPKAFLLGHTPGSMGTCQTRRRSRSWYHFSGKSTWASRAAPRGWAAVCCGTSRLRQRNPGKPAATLTRREFEILELLGEGLSNKSIARRLGISLGTTKSHVHNLLGKLSTQRRIDAARLLASRSSELRPTPPFPSIPSPSLDG